MARERVDDGWGTAGEALPPFKTTVTLERAKSVLQKQDTPEPAFDYAPGVCG